MILYKLIFDSSLKYDFAAVFYKKECGRLKNLGDLIE